MGNTYASEPQNIKDINDSNISSSEFIELSSWIFRKSEILAIGSEIDITIKKFEIILILKECGKFNIPYESKNEYQLEYNNAKKELVNS